jgi:RNA polymerase sigma-70 factor (ECF subfamily)
MTEKNSDKELLQRIAKGDDWAFEQLFRSYYARLVVFARKFVLDHDLAQSIVQSVFVKIWEKRDQLHIENIAGYLMISVRNQCFNELKQQKILVSIDEKPSNFLDRPDEFIPDQDVYAKVHEVISEMPPQRQKIFRMNRFDGLKYKEIATLLDLSVKTVEAQMGKALQFLREKLPRVIETEGPS